MAKTPALLPKLPFRARSALCAAFLGLAVAGGAPALADDLAAIQKQIRRGETGAAIERLDAHLRTAPDDARAQFLKGVALADAKRDAEAIAVFTRLTEEHPELPESYNNLAVLYARQNLYERARQALEMAIQAHPSYAIAYENLGDLYVTLAARSYEKAGQLDARNRSAPRKFTLARELLDPPAKPPAASETPRQ